MPSLPLFVGEDVGGAAYVGVAVAFLVALYVLENACVATPFASVELLEALGVKLHGGRIPELIVKLGLEVVGKGGKIPELIVTDRLVVPGHTGGKTPECMEMRPLEVAFAVAE